MISVRNYMLILLIGFPTYIFSQNVILQGQIGSFKNAQAFSINQAGNIFVADESLNEIIKIDTLGNVIKTIGGYGWQQSAFDEPVDIFSSTLNVYIADKNNNRVQIFDKDLNFLSEIKVDNSNPSAEFRYPSGIAVSNQGDIFILDSDNTRILKFDLRGKYLLQMGNFEAGKFALTNPKKFSLSPDQNIFVIDGNVLTEFDQFGNGIKKTKLDFSPVNLNSTPQNLILTDGKNIYVFKALKSDNEEAIQKFSPVVESEITDAILFNSKLYVLTPGSILIYSIIY